MGAGGFGRETYDALLAAGGHPDVVFLDEARAGSVVRGLPVLAPAATGPGEFVVSVADPAARRRLAEQMSRAGLVPRTVAHPLAAVGPETSVGPGSVLLAGAYVSSSVVLGRHVHVNYNATVGHDSVLEDCVTVYPGANVSGDVRIGSGASVGSNACVLQGLEVGADAFVGAGAVVTRSVPAGAVVVGAPARALRPGRPA